MTNMNTRTTWYVSTKARRHSNEITVSSHTYIDRTLASLSQRLARLHPKALALMPEVRNALQCYLRLIVFRSVR